METNNDDNNNGIHRAHPACAPCKHQRKKCSPDCLFAPYFPFEKKDEFKSVRRICSLKTLTKMIKNVEAPEDRQRLAEAVIWVAGCWDEDPVLGASGKYWRVQQQVEELKRENAALRQRLSNRIHQLAEIGNGWAAANNGYMAHHHHHHRHHQDHSYGTVVYPQNYHLQAGLEEEVKDVVQLYSPNGYQFCLPVQQQLQLQQQHTPNGYQYCLPAQLNGNVLDDTQWEGWP